MRYRISKLLEPLKHLKLFTLVIRVWVWLKLRVAPRTIGKWTVSLLATTAWGIVFLFLVLEIRNAIVSPPNDPFALVRSILLVIAAWIGLPFLIWRTLIAHSQKNNERDNYNAEALAKAVSLLGATSEFAGNKPLPAVEVRIGAIYALERLSQQSQYDYDRVIEILAAYVRDQCGPPQEFLYSGPDPDEQEITSKTRTGRLHEYCEALRDWHEQLRATPPAQRSDIAIALIVLFRSFETQPWGKPIEGSDPPKLYSVLSGLNLQGADISDLLLTVGETSTDLGLDNAAFNAASVNFVELKDGHSLVAPVVKFLPEHGLMVGPRSLSGCNLTSATMKLYEHFPRLEGATLTFANMEGAKCNSGSFRGAVLLGTNLQHIEAKRAKFGLIYAKDARFNWADLEKSEFNGAYLKGTQFAMANLRDACFDGADVEGTVFDGAILTNADLSGVRNLSEEQLKTAFGTLSTKLPNDVVRPPNLQYANEQSLVVEEEWTSMRNSRWPAEERDTSSDGKFKVARVGILEHADWPP